MTATLPASPLSKPVMVPIYKLLMVKDSAAASPARRIKSPVDAAALAMTYMQDLDREHLIVILLNAKSDIIGINTVAIGGLNTTYVPMREVLKPALLANASAIIVAHNHPSGDPTPSPEDVSITRRIVDAGNLLGIDVLDHVVCGEGRWVSLRERGLGF